MSPTTPSSTTGTFPPATRAGLILHGSLIAALGTLSGWSFWRLSSESVGLAFVVYLVLGVAAFLPLPLLGYRAYALYRAVYILDRDTLEIRWGLRSELIPLSDIEWVRPTTDLTKPLGLPGLPLPGAILGMRRHADLGVVEFLSDRARGMLLVGTPHRVYAISPARPQAFLDTFARAVELGSLHEAEPHSLYPSFVFSRAWGSGLIRFAWLATLFLNLGLIAWISLLVPSSAQFTLGFEPDRTPDVVPSVQLIIVPVVSVLASLVSWFAGLYLFRFDRDRILAIAVWVGAAVSSLLFVLAVLFIVTYQA